MDLFCVYKCTNLYVCVCGYVTVNPKWHTIMVQNCSFSFNLVGIDMMSDA